MTTTPATTADDETIDVPLADLAGHPFYTPRRGGKWMVLTPNDLTRIEAKIDPEDNDEGCWRWLPPPNQHGYPQIHIQGDTFITHHLLSDLLHGRPREGYVRGHRCHDEAVLAGTCEGGRDCRHRRCVNPMHIITTQTREENIAAGVPSGRKSR